MITLTLPLCKNSPESDGVILAWDPATRLLTISFWFEGMSDLELDPVTLADLFTALGDAEGDCAAAFGGVP